MDNQDNAAEGQKGLHKKAREYVKYVMASGSQETTFSLNQGIRIVEEIIGFQSVSDALFLASIYYDDTDDLVAAHHVNVAVFAIKMAKHMGWKRNRLREVGTAALLHDVGYDILSIFDDDHAYLAECALRIKELISGRPCSLDPDEDNIDQYAQIIGLLNIYEAFIHTRRGCKRKSHVSAVMEIAKSTKNVFQTCYIKAMLNIFSGFPVNSYVRLESNDVGRVIESYPAQPFRPKIQIVFDGDNKRLPFRQTLDLRKNFSLCIIDPVTEGELLKLYGAQISTSAEAK